MLDYQFIHYKVPEEEKVQNALTHFRDSALDWWKFLLQQHKVSETTLTLTWAELKQLLLEKFRIVNEEVIFRQRLRECNQRSTVQVYNNLFNNLFN